MRSSGGVPVTMQGQTGLEKLRAYVEKLVTERNEPLRAADEIPMQPARLLAFIAAAERDELTARKALYDEIRDHARTKMDVAAVQPCNCTMTCGDDGDTEGPGTCKGLPRPKPEPLVRVTLVDRRDAR